MILDESEIQRVLRRFDRLKKASIDSSSIIYMKKAGYLELLANVLSLAAVPSVLGEVGEPCDDISVLDPEDTGVSTDRQVYNLAVAMNMPVISDDRSILMHCRETGVDFYNSYMMLFFLRYRGDMDNSRYQEFQAKLESVAHYGRDVLKYTTTFSTYLERSY